MAAFGGEVFCASCGTIHHGIKKDQEKLVWDEGKKEWVKNCPNCGYNYFAPTDESKWDEWGVEIKD